MAIAFMIEIDDEPVGLALRVTGGFKFVASDQRYHPLDGRIFKHVRDAHRAALKARPNAPMPWQGLAANDAGYPAGPIARPLSAHG